MEIVVGSRGWDLPSWHPASLALQLYVRLAKIECSERATPYLYCPLSPSGALPVLIDGSSVVHLDPIAYLQHNFVNVDSPLTAAEKAGVLAFRALVEKQMAPAFEFLCWKSNENYKALKTLFQQGLPFPLSAALPSWERRRQTDLVRQTHGFKDMESAIRCLSRGYHSLSQWLGSKKYFGGDHPCSLDAVVAAHIAVHYQCALPEPQQNCLRKLLLTQYPRLAQHFQRVLSEVTGFEPTMSLTALMDETKEEEPKWERKLPAKCSEQEEEKEAKKHSDVGVLRRKNAWFFGGVLFSVVLYIGSLRWIRSRRRR